MVLNFVENQYRETNETGEAHHNLYVGVHDTNWNQTNQISSHIFTYQYGNTEIVLVLHTDEIGVIPIDSLYFVFIQSGFWMILIGVNCIILICTRDFCTKSLVWTANEGQFTLSIIRCNAICRYIQHHYRITITHPTLCDFHKNLETNIWQRINVMVR